MAFDHYVRSGQTWLRCGYTTGTCAALAAAGAARYLLTGEAPSSMSLITPKGLRVEVPILEPMLGADCARCAVEKDGGDDVDATHGALIVAEVQKKGPSGIVIDGGEGVGRVTRPGLEQPVGSAAINRVPRQMIAQAVRAECARADYGGGLSVTISVPGGADIARRTFNPVLGIEGGISILGTSGVVEPMSDQAIVDTIGVELHQARAAGADRLILTPGNYGLDFLKANALHFPGVPLVKYSNFIGEALDLAGVEGFAQVLLVGHIGKLVKVAGGIMNTHSKWADCRLELFCAHAAVCGGDTALCQALLSAPTTDRAIALLDEAGLRQAVMDRLLEAIQLHLDRRAAGSFQVGAVVFSNEFGLLGQTDMAKELLMQWNR